MTPGNLMLCGGITFVIGMAVVIFNFVGMIGDRKLSGGGVLIHLLVGIVAGCGFLSLIGGFIWFLVDKYAK